MPTSTCESQSPTTRTSEVDLDAIKGAVRTILEAVGEDPDRPGLKDTPRRVAKLGSPKSSTPYLLRLICVIPSSGKTISTSSKLILGSLWSRWYRVHLTCTQSDI